jgi:glycosyltransferase involved in cell wall biosynthesis
VAGTDFVAPKGSERTTFSLVLCTLGNRRVQLGRLLRSLANQEFRLFEVVLVDQNPPGYLDDILQATSTEFTLRHVTSGRGLSVARNVGLLNATGEIVGFPDDDCWYFAGTLAQVASFFDRNQNIDILLGRTVDDLGRPSLSPLRRESGSVNRSNVWSSGNSNTLFVRRDVVSLSGGFDEQLGVGAPSLYQSGEETDFILKLVKKGARAVYLNQLKIGHGQVENAGLIPTLKRAWIYSLGFGCVLKKHKFGSAYLTYRIVRSLAGTILALIRLRPVYGLSRLVWSAGTLVGYLSAKQNYT